MRMLLPLCFVAALASVADARVVSDANLSATLLTDTGSGGKYLRSHFHRWTRIK